MILQALYDLAEREELLEDPDFEEKPIAWLLKIGQDGRLLGDPVGTHYIPNSQQDKKKPKAVPKTFSVPREAGRTSGARAFFFFDKAEYVFGIDPDGKRPAEQLSQRSEMFRERVRECAGTTGDEGARAVLCFLEDLAEGRQAVALPDECKGNDLFAFIYAPDVERLVTAREKVRAYWKEQRAESAAASSEETVCLITGKRGAPADLFPQLKKVPGGSTSGVALVSFNKPAFESHGWSGNQNAPVSREAAEASATALNYLLGSNERRYQISADTAVCFWSKHSAKGDLATCFIPILEANPEEASKAYKSIWSGKAPEIDDPSAFYALTLTGTQGRAIVRDWFESTVGEVQKSLAQYFSEIDIVRNARPAKGKELPPAFPLRHLINSLAAPGRSEGAPGHVQAQLIRAALDRDVRYPLTVLQRALLRYRAEIGKTEWLDISARDARATLIKAVLCRNYKNNIKREMNPNNTEPAYRLGRMMAIVERMQQLALGDVNASVVDRYFASASATPANVFPKLLKAMRNHFDKARDGKYPGAAINLEKLSDEVLSKVELFPLYLDMQEQGLFILGYHHQRYEFFKKKEVEAPEAAID